MTIRHSKTLLMETITQRVDGVCITVGPRRFLADGMTKQGTVVIDIGISIALEVHTWGR
ncbi:MAG: hypothetical protein U9Q94_05275 [Candidatus Bipolaricaulota bacterium]|nr:hypothetical protein [Candidatus Bipolaricaulota bacterium]